MKKILIRIMCAVCLLFILAASGCVAPPKETLTPGGTGGGVGGINNPGGVAAETTTQNQNILAEATPFQVSATPTLAYHTIVAATPIPEDMVCLVDFSDLNMALEANKTAKTFNLLNPPMYINYSIKKPFNVTGTRVSTSRSTGRGEISTKYSYYSPYSYLEFTVRNPTTGEIYTQDGFGKTYGTSLNKTIRITKTGNLLIEISGFNVTPTIGFWIKPSQNFENSTIDFTKLECQTQDYVKRLNMVM
jgi:hypothetical protein